MASDLPQLEEGASEKRMSLAPLPARTPRRSKYLIPRPALTPRADEAVQPQAEIADFVKRDKDLKRLDLHRGIATEHTANRVNVPLPERVWKRRDGIVTAGLKPLVITTQAAENTPMQFHKLANAPEVSPRLKAG